MSNQLDIAQVQAWLANPQNAQSIGLKYAPRARVNVSANQDRTAKNLLFSDKGKSGALGRDADGNIYYMANIRGRGKFPSFPLVCSKVGITKENKLHVEIDYALADGYEVTLAKAWLNKTATPTLEPAKARNTDGTPSSATTTSVETETETVTQPASAPVTQTAPTSSGGFDESKLSLVQKAVRKKAIEIGIFPDEATANANFDQWKNTTMKELA